ncbi:MAG TPA: glycoside hydrolase family 3 N-terminal domain-containing protein, partial [Anaerolineaceae bacterium]
MKTAAFPYQDPTLPVAERVKDLLARMTVAEKIGQTNQVWLNLHNIAEIEQQAKHGLVGSVLTNLDKTGRTTSVETLNALQRAAVEGSRLGIPFIHGRDVIHGHRTVFPLPLALAASFDPAAMEEASAVAAREAASAGVHWTFTPMLDIARDPRWGRCVEGSGEDPYLGAQM